MNVETTISVLVLAYTIISFSMYSFARRLRDSIVAAFSMATAVFLLYLSFQGRGVFGLIGAVGSANLLFSLFMGEMKKVERRAMFSMLGVYFVSVSMLLASTRDSLRIFIYWEVIAMLMIGSMALYRRDEGYEAALKYAVICLPASIVGLFGLIIALQETGVTSFPQILLNASDLAKYLMAVGFGAEVALFPMYVWLPSLYVGMHPLLLSVEVSSVLPATTYIVGTIASSSTPVALATSSLAITGSLIGSLSAIVQRDLRKLLSYSTLSHIGYIILGLSVGSALARDYSLLHMVAHAIPKASLVMLSLALLSKLGDSSVEGLSRFGGSYKFVAIGGALALLGLPPFLSFWSELFIFLGTFSSTMPWKILSLLFFTAILISTGYSFKIIYSFSKDSSEAKKFGTDAYGALLLLFFLFSLLLSPIQSYIISYFLGPI
ncbi:MAG: proton-conducting transporter membrane subunit [Fervidicoccaceae archaeon]